MAKEDFCFTYYDGDAARDKAHLGRLQRGAYDDIISAQRKFGHLTIEVIQRVLGSDFESCWTPLEWVLKRDEEGKYYIDWLEISIQKMRVQSKIQKGKAEDRWKREKEKTDAVALPQHSNGNAECMPRDGVGIAPAMPIENENGKEVLGKSENPLKWETHPRPETKVQLRNEEVIQSQEWTRRMRGITLTDLQVNELWGAFCIQYFTGKKRYVDRSECTQHFRNWIKDQKLEFRKSESGQAIKIPSRFKDIS
jgi:hypothetical protein